MTVFPGNDRKRSCKDTVVLQKSDADSFRSVKLGAELVINRKIQIPCLAGYKLIDIIARRDALAKSEVLTFVSPLSKHIRVKLRLFCMLIAIDSVDDKPGALGLIAAAHVLACILIDRRLEDHTFQVRLQVIYRREVIRTSVCTVCRKHALDRSQVLIRKTCLNGCLPAGFISLPPDGTDQLPASDIRALTGIICDRA